MSKPKSALTNAHFGVRQYSPNVPAAEIDRKLTDLTDGSYEVIAVEVFDAPLARVATVADANRFGVDVGSMLGEWVLGRPEAVHAFLAYQGWVEFTEQYGAGYNGEVEA